MDVQHVALLHRVIVTLFLFFFLFKTILLITKKTDLLDRVRAKTKIVDMVLGVLVLATGVYMMMLTKNHSMWINIKVLIVLAVIPLGIVAMKKSNVVMAVVVNVLLIAAYGIGESRPWNKTQREQTEESTADSTAVDTSMTIQPTEVSEDILKQNQVAISTNAGEIYRKFCVNCHGEAGNMAKFNAADLTTSTMGMQERIAIITNGKGLMAPYKDDLSAEEIEALAVYLTTLRR